MSSNAFPFARKMSATRVATGATFSYLYAEIDANRYRGALVPASKQTFQRGMSAGVLHLF